MGQVLRGIGARRAATMALFALGVVVVAGTLTAVTFSELTGTPVGAVGALLLLGAVAVSVQSGQVARLRRTEIALAQIRGRTGTRLYAYYLTEPFVVLLAAAAVGVPVGRWVTERAAHRWLGDQVPVTISQLGAGSVVLAVVLGLAGVIAGSHQTLQQPLVEQLDQSRRPRQSATLVLLGQTVVIVAAAIATYEATQGGDVREDWRGLASPALLTPVLIGLASAQVAAWLLALGSSWAVRRPGRSARRGLGLFLAVRRLARRRDTVGGTRLVVAAAVVAAVTVSGSGAVTAWTAETARLQLGGPQRMAVEGGALTAYTVSHGADPGGRWLMAVTAAPDRSEAYRRSFADMERWDRVVGGFLAGTGAAAVSAAVNALQAGEPLRTATGTKASVTFVRTSLRHAREVGVTIDYVNDTGQVASVALAPTARPGPGVNRVTKPIAGCLHGCVVNQVTVDGWTRGRGDHLVLGAVEFGTRDLLADRRWRVQPGDKFREALTYEDDRLDVALPWLPAPLVLTDVASRQPLAAVSTPGLTLLKQHRAPMGFGPDGSDHPVDVVGTASMLPYLGRQGVLIDLPRALAGATSMIPTAAAAIIARADTPAGVLAELEASGQVSTPRAYSAILRHARAAPAAQGIRLYLLMSVFAGLIAGVSLIASVLAQRADRRDEAASLRVSGVPVSSITGAHAVEAFVLALTAFVVVWLAGWVASGASLGALSLVPQSDYLPLLGGPNRPWEIIAVAAGAGLLVGGVTYAAYRSVARSSPPSLLRVGAGR